MLDALPKLLIASSTKVRVHQPRFEGDVETMGFGRKNWKIGKLEYEKWFRSYSNSVRV